jgi:hypothetical protein
MTILFFGLNFCTNVKNKYAKEIFDHFLKKKKSLDFQKIENQFATFCIGFGLVTIFQMFR